MKPAISILIANFNNGHFFKDAFDSLVAQTESNWEAIVIDDASTDNSVSVIKELIRGDDRFRFFENEVNIGYQKTLLRAVSLAKADIFGRLDPDDTLEPEAVEYSLNAHIAHPEVGLVYSDCAVYGEDGEFWSLHKCQQSNGTDKAYLNLQGEISHFSTFKMKLYNKTNGIDDTILRAEDKDIYMKMCELAPVLHLPTVLYNYRYHNGGSSTMRNEFKAYFWHWVALVKMMERRAVDIEDLFVEHIIDRATVDPFEERSIIRRRWIENIHLASYISRFLNKKIQ